MIVIQLVTVVCLALCGLAASTTTTTSSPFSSGRHSSTALPWTTTTRSRYPLPTTPFHYTTPPYWSTTGTPWPTTSMPRSTSYSYYTSGYPTTTPNPYATYHYATLPYSTTVSPSQRWYYTTTSPHFQRYYYSPGPIDVYTYHNQPLHYRTTYYPPCGTIHRIPIDPSHAPPSPYESTGYYTDSPSVSPSSPSHTDTNTYDYPREIISAAATEGIPVEYNFPDSTTDASSGESDYNSNSTEEWDLESTTSQYEVFTDDVDINTINSLQPVQEYQRMEDMYIRSGSHVTYPLTNAFLLILSLILIILNNL